jgi:hypothetical protein
MTCILGGVTLENTPIWIDKAKYEDLATQTSTAIDGSEIVVNAARGAQYPVTLVSQRETGWIKTSTITSLRALSAVPNAYYTLTLNGTPYTVRFRNEQSGGAIQMQTLGDGSLPHSNPGSDDYWYGTIYLMCTG